MVFKNMRPINSLSDMLRFRAESDRSQNGFGWLGSGESLVRWINYSDLDRRAKAVAASLQQRRLEKKVVSLLFNPGLDFVVGLFGAWYAGAIPVPLYAPRSSRDWSRLSAILSNCRPAGLLATSADLFNRDRCGEQRNVVPENRVNVDEVEIAMADLWKPRRAIETAYLQYTSGSTSNPRGVVVTHKNALANLSSIARDGSFVGNPVSVSWLPHFHDMGLVYGMLQPIFSGFNAYLLSPAGFTQHPLRWLQAISHFRGTHCGGPNFAYDLCVDRTNEEERKALDLSSWRVAFNGAEPVRAETLTRFARTFSCSGFKRSAFYPVYGLAEATLKVTSPAPESGANVLLVTRKDLLGNKVTLAKSDGDDTVSLVGCGKPGLKTKILIVDPVTRSAVKRGKIGEVWVSGPSVAAGYWKNSRATREIFKAWTKSPVKGPFLRTGDLGFVRRGELFVTGRLKDCVIVRGPKLLRARYRTKRVERAP